MQHADSKMPADPDWVDPLVELAPTTSAAPQTMATPVTKGSPGEATSPGQASDVGCDIAAKLDACCVHVSGKRRAGSARALLILGWKLATG